jgi:hypothetical protein
MSVFSAPGALVDVVATLPTKNEHHHHLPVPLPIS